MPEKSRGYWVFKDQLSNLSVIKKLGSDLMYMTVRQLLNTAPFKSAEVVAGKEGLDNKFYIITPLDTPDIVDWLRGYELLITQGYAIKDESPHRRTLIRDLAAKKVSGVMIKKGRYLDNIPQYMIDDANKYSIPIVRIPYEINWDAIMGPVDYAAFSFFSELIDVILKGRGLDSICHEIQKLIQSTIVILDENFMPIGGSSLISEDLLEEINESALKCRYSNLPCARYHYSNELMIEKGIRGELIALDYRGKRYGYLMALVDRDIPDLSEYDAMTLEIASIAVILEIIKNTDINYTRYRLWDDFMVAILEGHFNHEEEVYQRGKAIGINFSSSYAVVIGNVDPSTNVYKRMGRIESNVDVINAFRAAYANHHHNGKCHDFFNHVLFTSYKEGIVFFIPQLLQNGRVPLDNIIKQLHQILCDFFENPDIKLTVGNFYEPHRLFNSYREASQALALSSFFTDKVIYYNKLGAFKLFLDSYGGVDMKTMEEIYAMALKPLVEYDQQNNSDLVDTLERYLKNDLSVSKTAESLFLHKNTLRYRLEKIEKITNMSLKSLADLVNFTLALHLRIPV